MRKLYSAYGLTKKCLLLLLLLFVSEAGRAETVRVAVSSNFANTLGAISTLFEEQTEHKVLVSAASTGKHYAQIKQGAPFDIFLAADSARPERIVEEGLVKSEQRMTYAFGRLVLWSHSDRALNRNTLIAIEQERLAIANPELAPYGVAAQQFIDSLGIADALDKQLVLGENIGQALQYVATGNAEYGLIALSQIIKLSRDNRVPGNSYWLVPSDMHAPIQQDAILLNPSVAARAFFAFLKTDAVKTIIRESGYETP